MYASNQAAISQAWKARDSSEYVPPASSSTPDAGVTHTLHCRMLSTYFMDPANVAATSSGMTYLQRTPGYSAQRCRCHGSHTWVLLAGTPTLIVSTTVKTAAYRRR